MRRVLVIGGGASGLTAAIAAAEQGAKVTLLEKNRQVGKKILVTGNGRCNLTNENQDEACYRGGEPGFARTVFGNFGLPDTLRFFERLGVCAKSRNGYLYPYSDQASSVGGRASDGSGAPRREAGSGKSDSGDQSAESKWCFRRLRPPGRGQSGGKLPGTALLSPGRGSRPGQRAGPTRETPASWRRAPPPPRPQARDGSGYALAESLGHRLIKPLPALVQLRCRERFYERLAGLRMEAAVRVLADGKETACDRGEVQFTRNGISGIPVFQVSRHAVRGAGRGTESRSQSQSSPSDSGRKLRTVSGERRGRGRAGDFF